MKTSVQFCIMFLFIIINSDSNAQWVTVNSGTSLDLKDICFTDAVTGYASGSTGILLKSTNSGNNWIIQNSGTSQNLNSIHFFNALTGIACGNSGVIIRTTNGGLDWFAVTSGVPDHLFGISFADDMNGICSGNNGDLLWSSNGGVNWSVSVSGFLVTYYSSHMVTASTGYAAGVNTIFTSFIAKTTNGGMNWAYNSFYINGNEGNVRGIYFKTAEEGFAACNVWNGQGSVSRTTNGGQNWTSQMFTSALNDIYFPNPITGYTAGFNGTIMKTSDGGISWFEQISNVSTHLKAIFFIDTLTGYSVGDLGVILRTTNGGVTSVKGKGGTVASWRVYQNHPNPFNNSTLIKFSIPEAGTIRIVLYDILGRELIIVADQWLQPGNYETSFNGADFSSGVYIYDVTLNSGSELLFRDRKKMVIVK